MAEKDGKGQIKDGTKSGSGDNKQKPLPGTIMPLQRLRNSKDSDNVTAIRKNKLEE